MSAAEGPLGIIAGGGGLPLAIAKAASARGRPVFIAGIEGMADPAVEAFPHARFHLGKLGRLFGLLRDQGCRDVVIAGRADRPEISALRLDGTGLRSLPRILSILVGGDDTVLGGVVAFIEEQGFRVVGVGEVAPQLVAARGLIGRRRPSAREEADIATGLDALAKLGPLDMGQALVVLSGRIIAVEAAEGTDAMITRVGEVRKTGRITAKTPSGVLVKGPKPQQDLRVDMPVIGRGTIDRAAQAGLAGIAVVSGGVLLLDASELAQAADAASLFLTGVERTRHGC